MTARLIDVTPDPEKPEQVLVRFGDQVVMITIPPELQGDDDDAQD